jgi:hypothetical protein
MYEIDELAGIVALANEKEQQALIADINRNGQQEPAVLWQGKLVDGRCRQIACTALGIELKVRELDSSLSRAQVALIVKSLNTRRNLTTTQKIASGYKQYKRTGETMAEIAEQWAISVPSLKNFNYIAKAKPEWVDVLFDGNSVKVHDPDKGFDVTTNKVNTLARIIKKQVEDGKIVVDTSEVLEFSADGVLKTEAAKDWYYGIINTTKTNDVVIKMLLVELANLKFKMVE